MSKKTTEKRQSRFYYSRISDVPDINIISNKEACITGICSVVEYTQDLIRLNCGHLLLTVKGGRLNMTALSVEEVIIKGELLSVEFSYCQR